MLTKAKYRNNTGTTDKVSCCRSRLCDASCRWIFR